MIRLNLIPGNEYDPKCKYDPKNPPLLMLSMEEHKDYEQKKEIIMLLNKNDVLALISRLVESLKGKL